MSETYKTKLCGHPARLILDHRTAWAVYETTGRPFPAIPKGCNTFTDIGRLPDGRPVMAVNQTGFSPLAEDNENQVNGLTVTILENTNLSDTEATTIFEKIYKEIFK